MNRVEYRTFWIKVQAGTDEGDRPKYRWRIVRFGPKITDLWSGLDFESDEEALSAAKQRVDEIIAEREKRDAKQSGVTTTKNLATG